MKPKSLCLLSLLLIGASINAESPGSCYSGAYQLEDGSQFVVQPSEGKHLRYRMLDGKTGRLFYAAEGRFESGEGWATREPVTLRLTFGPCERGTIESFARTGERALRGQRVPLPMEPVRFERDGIGFYGELVLPVARKPRALVVLQYGSGRESAVDHNYVQYLLPLHDIAVFVFDKRGTGRSAGEYNADIDVLAHDMVAAVQAASGELRDVPVGLMGESQGGWVAPLAATRTAVDFVIVSYGLAISMQEEDRQEVVQALKARGHDADAIAKAEAVQRVTTRIIMSRFEDGIEELRQMQERYGKEAWFADLDGDYTAPLASSTPAQLEELREFFSFPIDLEYEPLPTLRKLRVPQLWLLAGDDTEAPQESTLARLEDLQREGLPIDVVVYPDTEHGMIAVEHTSAGTVDLGRTAPGYFEKLAAWITATAQAAK